METALRQLLDKYLVLSEEDLGLITSQLVVRQFPRRTVIIQEGETEEYLSFVAKGILRKYFYKGRQEVITQLADEGTLISSSVSFFSAMPSQYYIETLEPVTLLSLSRESLHRLYIQIPKMEKLARLIITDLYLQKEKWEQDSICFSIKERFTRFVEEHPYLLKRVPQKYIASYLNIKPETFSRLKHLLNKSTAVTV
ncbi:MAG TPA: Crp/Fnr family transcriptional regulator [Chitinophagaceae bacterium]|nr:Crp/Fnr family transcriptional regulator [Chitinophagaceae bacterium]